MRISGKKHDISYEATLQFFEGRGRAAQPDAPQTATMYQDKELACRRDACEKETVLPLLELRSADRALDIGCGAGRWAEVLSGRTASYLGIDFSASLLKLAERFRAPGVSFQCLPAQEVSPAALALPPPFDLFICSGILIYLNDDDVLRLGQRIAAMAAPGARLYLREPMARAERLTLDRFPSAELQTEYSASYRTLEQCDEIFGAPLRQGGFRLLLERSLYPPELCNRKETEQHIQLWAKL
jgi:SAM-dependent methyltransferase